MIFFWLYFVIGVVEGFIAVRTVKNGLKNMHTLSKKELAETRSILSVIDSQASALGLSEDAIYTILFVAVVFFWLPIEVNASVKDIFKKG